MLPCVLLPLCEGNDILRLMTTDKRQRLRVDMRDFSGNRKYAKYNNFRIDSGGAKYRLASLGTYSGNAGQKQIYFYCDFFALHCTNFNLHHRFSQLFKLRVLSYTLSNSITQHMLHVLVHGLMSACKKLHWAT